MAGFDPESFVQKYGAPAAPAAGGATGSFDPASFVQKYGGSSAPAKEAPEQTVQEMHPDFSVADRFVVKNFATTPEAAVNYLQQRHPNLEVATDNNGEIRARAKGSKESWKVLDPSLDMPSTGSTWGDIKRGAGEGLMDLGDVAWDALAGAGTTAASAAGGLVGGLPGGMLAGGAAGAGLEGARQGIGNMLGVADGVNGGQLAAAGAGGTLGPLLFGTGAGAAQVGARAAEQGLSGDAAQELLASQRGMLGRARDAVKPLLFKGAEKISGVSKNAIQGLTENYPEIMAAAKDPMALTNMTEGAASEVGGALRTAKKEAWSNYQSQLRDVKTPIDVTEARSALERAIAEAEGNAKSTGNEASSSLVEKLRDAYKKHFMTIEKTATPTTEQVATGLLDASGQPIMKTVEGTAESAVPKKIDALPVKAAAQLERQLAELADFSSTSGSGVGNRFAAGTSFEDKAVATAAADAKKKLQAAIEETLPAEALAAKAKYGQVSNLEREIQPLFETPKTTAQTFRNLSRPHNRTTLEQLGQIDREYGTGIIPQARKAEAFQVFANPTISPMSAGGASGLARAGMLGGAGAGLGYEIDKHYGSGEGYPGMAVGGALGSLMGSPAALRAYIGMGRKVGAAPNYVTPAASQSVWNMLNH